MGLCQCGNLIGLNGNSHSIRNGRFAAFAAGALVDRDDLDACLDQFGHVSGIGAIVATSVDAAGPVDIDTVTGAQEARDAT